MKISRHSVGPDDPRRRNAKPARVQADPGPASPGRLGCPVRVVIVDDSPVALKALTSLLQTEGNMQLIGSATDGYAAVRRVIELEPDVVFMDLQMPGMNGLEATRQIKAHPHAPRVILVTSDGSAACRKAARAAGTDGFVAKQDLFSHLRPAIRKLFPRSTN